jgi:hypothetical protein
MDLGAGLVREGGVFSVLFCSEPLFGRGQGGACDAGRDRERGRLAGGRRWTEMAGRAAGRQKERSPHMCPATGASRTPSATGRRRHRCRAGHRYKTILHVHGHTIAQVEETGLLAANGFRTFLQYFGKNPLAANNGFSGNCRFSIGDGQLVESQ